MQSFERSRQFITSEFWIVNGFAASTTGEACRKLAASEAVSFIYFGAVRCGSKSGPLPR